MQLPPYLSISGGVLSDAAPALSTGEQASIRPMAPARLAEFAQGRMHARKALARLGLANACIPVASDRAPVWPEGFVGSISHVPADRARKLPGQVIAVAARTTECSGVGVDLERTDRLLPEHWSAFMTERELHSIAMLCVPQRNAFAHCLWSAKEAVMKALCRPLEPRDIEVNVHIDEGTFSSDCRICGADRRLCSIHLSGWLSHAEGWVLSLVAVQSTLPPRPVVPAPEFGNQPG